jgi:hypothetical protein
MKLMRLYMKRRHRPEGGGATDAVRAHYSTRRRYVSNSVREWWRVDGQLLRLSGYTRARSIFVPERQPLASLSDDEALFCIALSELVGDLSRS